jgi:very-short-patch-repair endonuclease
MRVEQEVRVSRWLIDIALPDIATAVEIDGVYWHSLPGAADRDRRKNARLARDGWRVERFTVAYESPIEVVELIERRLSLDATQVALFPTVGGAI